MEVVRTSREETISLVMRKKYFLLGVPLFCGQILKCIAKREVHSFMDKF